MRERFKKCGDGFESENFLLNESYLNKRTLKVFYVTIRLRWEIVSDLQNRNSGTAALKTRAEDTFVEVSLTF